MSALLDQVRVLRGRRHSDSRGWLKVHFDAGQLGGLRFGELYTLRSEGPGQRRGDHFHREASELFSVVVGRARLELRDPQGGACARYVLDAEDPLSVLVPPGLAHCLLSEGAGPMIAIAWSSHAHDPEDVHPCSAAPLSLLGSPP